MKKTIFSVIITLLLLSNSLHAESVNRAIFTSAIEDREPVDQIDTIDSAHLSNVTFFTELVGLEGRSVTHQWIYDDHLMFEKTFNIGSNRWRVWSSKSFLPTWTGEWTVKVLDEDLSLLTAETIILQ